MIELVERNIQAIVIRSGVGQAAIDPPATIEIHTTGEAGEVLLNAGPARGKRWVATVRVEIVETDD